MIDFSKYQGKPQHCCLIMDMLLGEGYLDPTIMLSGEDCPPSIPGKLLNQYGRKRNPSMRINFCPGCGKKLTKETESDGSNQ